MSEHMQNTSIRDEVARPAEQPRRRWVLWGGLAAVVILVIGAAFVGGRLLSQRHLVRTSGPGVVEVKKAAELPDEPPVASGPVQKVEGKTITLETAAGGTGIIYFGPGGVEKKEGEWKQIQVVVTQDTKIYKGIPLSPEEMEKGGEFQAKVEEATLADIKVGDHIVVWGQESGERLTAEVIHIQRMLGFHGP
jgi:hypothetical protein